MDTMPRRRDLRVNIDNSNMLDSGFTTGSCASSFSDASCYTPTSGRSTPSFYSEPTTFDPNFSQNTNLTYGFSPASSVASQELQGMCGMSFDFSSANSSFMDTPSTPTRCHSNSGHLMVPDNSFMHQYTPTHSSDMEFNELVFNDPFSPAHHFVTPSRTFYVQPSHSPEEMGAWPMLENSPLGYRHRQGVRPVYKREMHPPMFNFREQVGLGPVQQKSAALQQVASMPRVHREARMRVRPTLKSSKSESAIPPRKGMIPCVETTTVQKRRIPCQWEGCTAAFSRSEHLTRHHRNKHLKIIEAVCKCCEDQNIYKPFDRHDNYLTHLALHVSGQGRVKFHPDAAKLHAEELAKVKRRAPSQRQIQKKIARQSSSSDSSKTRKSTTYVESDVKSEGDWSELQQEDDWSELQQEGDWNSDVCVKAEN